MENSADTVFQVGCEKCKPSRFLPAVLENYCSECAEKLNYKYKLEHYCRFCGKKLERVFLICPKYSEKWNGRLGRKNRKVSNGHDYLDKGIK